MAEVATPTAYNQFNRQGRDASPSSSEHSHDNENNGDSPSGVWQDDNDPGQSQNGSRKRKRPMSVSCEMCKHRKVKCDRGQPACGWCLRNNQLCEYKERKKPGLRAGYGRELESRLDHLETVLRAQQNAIAQLAAGVFQQSHGIKQQSPVVFGSASDHTTATKAKESDIAVVTPSNAIYTPQTPSIGEFSGAVNPLVGQTYSQPQQVEMARAGGPSLLQEQSITFPSSGGHLSNPVHADLLKVYQAVNSSDQDLPPYDLLYSLVDFFFKNINTWCPILHKRATLDAVFGPSRLEEPDRILLHAIVATTLRFSSDPRLTAESRSRYHKVSRQKVLLYAVDTSSVRALQALVILALDTCGSSNGPPGWNLLALLSRSAVRLGLSVETTSAAIAPKYHSIYTLRATFLPEPSNFIEEESRRRLFWMIYILDRYTTLTTAFDFALDEKEIDRRLPCRDEFFTKNQAVETSYFSPCKSVERGSEQSEYHGPFSYYVEVLGILSRIHLFLKKPVDITLQEDVTGWRKNYRELDQTLHAWKRRLPKEISNIASTFEPPMKNKTISCCWVMLHAIYHTTVIRLHTSAAYPARHSHIFTPSLSASQCCIKAVESITGLCAYIKDSGMLCKLGPTFAFTVWVAARVMLVHGLMVDHQINPEIHLLVSTLQDIGVYWNVATRYATLLQRVLEEFAESERAPIIEANGERATPSSVKILSDMRRCAYDLDWLISRQPRLQVGSGQREITTPMRTPAPDDFEYFDVFEFFNMPRMPLNTDIGVVGAAGNGSAVQAFSGADMATGNDADSVGFMYEPSADWFSCANP